MYLLWIWFMIWMLSLAYKGFLKSYQEELTRHKKSIASKFTHEEIEEIFRKYKQ